MCERFEFKLVFLVILVTVSLILCATPNAYAGGTEPGACEGSIDVRNIHGVFTAEFVPAPEPPANCEYCVCSPSYSALLVIDYGEGPLVIRETRKLDNADDFQNTTAEDIEGWCIPTKGHGGADLIIERVTNFINTGEVIGAEVLLKAFVL